MKQCQQLLDIAKNAFLVQTVDKPTRITEYTENLLDLFFSNNQSLINRCEVLPGIADHDAIFVESSLRPMRVRKPPRKVHLYKKADFDSLRDELSAYLPEFTKKNCQHLSRPHLEGFREQTEVADQQVYPNKDPLGEQSPKTMDHKNNQVSTSKKEQTSFQI